MEAETAYLTQEQLDELRSELQRSVRRLERSLKISDEASRPVTLDQASVGRLSRMDALQNQHMSQGLRARETARYAQMLAALGRLDGGGYGNCAGCKQPISFERLLVFPETLRCAGCGDDV